MRLEPIEKPRGLFLRVMYRVLRAQFGRVIMPWKVAFARAPRLAPSMLGIYWCLGRSFKIDAETRLLVQHRVAEINGCAFCIDIGRAVAVKENLSLAKADAVANYATDPRFNAAERAALAYVDETTRNKSVSDQTFETLRAQFGEREIVEITWLVAIENFFNLINMPLGIESDVLCALPVRSGARTVPSR
ncbi:MAG: AhpD family alkylhydroperoxidase [Hyphomicrobiaceae bacterium]|jgi:AhpD family alkylhydroperoxidase